MIVNVVVQDGQSITGLIQQGSNVTITGSGTATDPYVISASGGGGGSGDRGWSPLIRLVSDGERRVQEVYDWTGGQGVKPAITGYIGATGIVQDIALATDVRGDKGQDGEQGPPGNDGAPGIQGEKGDKGDDGASAYEVAVDNGFVGTESQWLASLKGEQGEKGDKGDKGDPGDDGADGTDGKSAYQIWLDNGNTGSEQDFLDSLVGPAGTTDYNELQNKPTLGTAAAADVSDFATAAQGALAATAVQPGGLPTWTTISGKPDFVAEGANASAARTALGLGTAATQASWAFATAAQGELADTAVQPSDTSDVADAGKVVKYSNIGAVNTATPQFPENAVPLSYFDAGLSTKQNVLSNPSQAEAEAGTASTARSWTAQRVRQAADAAIAASNKVSSAQEGGVGVLVSNIIQVTQAQYDGLTPQAGTFYVIVG